jgi:hypothetical protein
MAPITSLKRHLLLVWRRIKNASWVDRANLAGLLGLCTYSSTLGGYGIWLGTSSCICGILFGGFLLAWAYGMIFWVLLKFGRNQVD